MFDKTVISSSDSLKFLVSGVQLLEFIQLSTKIITQFLEKDKRWKFKLLTNSLIFSLVQAWKVLPDWTW